MERCVQTSLGFDLWVNSDDYVGKLLLAHGVYEPAETDLVTRLVRPGDICLDAGCHIGYYTCLLARLAGREGRVFAFDANPQACERARHNLALNGLQQGEVIHAALGDDRGVTSFYLATNDQTGLSSLGRIPACKETISVPWLRLEDFLTERRIRHVRLLKLDVEGAEELVLRGAGRFLTDHLIDFILAECYDERFHLLQTSTERVARLLLEGTGYVGWEFGTARPAGWSRATRVQSRDDCNYLFASPSLAEPLLASVSLAPALIQLKTQFSGLVEELNLREQELAHLQEEKRQMENSAGWRLLTAWRTVRDFLAPAGSWHRRLYDSALGLLRGDH